MIFETQTDLIREEKAINTFVNIFKGSFEKLDQFDIDYKIFDDEYHLIAYAEVKGRNKNILDAYPLPVSLNKIIKLSNKKLNPVIIWSCNDGIIYGRIKNLVGTVKWGGRKIREGSTNDQEFMIYYFEQQDLKHIYFENTSNNI